MVSWVEQKLHERRYRDSTWNVNIIHNETHFTPIRMIKTQKSVNVKYYW
jgi:hypothetical protein